MKLIFKGLFLLLFFTHLHAMEVMSEGKIGYFRPTNDAFRQIYEPGAIYGIEMSFQTWRSLYSWISASCFPRSGHSLGEKSPTQVVMIPIGLGLKYLYSIKKWDLYAGGGILATYLHTSDHSPFVIENNSKWGIGGIAKIGALVHIKSSFFLDFFTDYSFIKIGPSDSHGGKIVPHSADLSGWSIGGGIGYLFGSRCS